MPRYLVERAFPQVHSYFAPDGAKSSCSYDGRNPNSIRKAAQSANISVDKIAELRALDGFHMWNGR